MEIVRLEIENVKRIRAAEIAPPPGPGVVVVRGPNGAGKSSVLDAIQYALAGKDSQPPEVVTRGEATGRVLVDLGEFDVERKWHEGGRQSLEIRAKDGARYPSPQAMLDGLVGPIAFDPSAFLRMTPKAKADALRKALGIDCSAIDRKRAALYAQRTDAGREADRLAGKLSAIAMPAIDVPDEETSADEVRHRIEEAGRVRSANDAARARLRVLVAEADKVERRLAEAQAVEADLLRRLAEAQERVRALSQARIDAISDAAQADGEVSALVDPDSSDLAAEVAAIERRNAAVREKRRRAEVAAEEAGARARVRGLTDEMKTLDDEKAALLAGASGALPGLTVDDSGIRVDGVPIEQASTAQQLRVAAAVAMAQNPKIRVVLLRSGSLLDSDSMTALRELCRERGFQAFVEVVADGGGLVIEADSESEKSS